MTKPGRGVRSLMLRTYITATVSSFILFVLMMVLLGFNIEDEIFTLQTSKAADQLLADPNIISKPHGTLQSLDMEYYIGTESMPPWMKAEISPSWRDASYEIFGEEYGHFHVVVRSLPSEETLYVLFNARPYIRSTPNIKAFLVNIASLAGLIFIMSLFFMYRISHRISAPLEDMAASLTSGSEKGSLLTLPKAAPKELHTLAQALEARDTRIQALIERERQFNRDASHELRTPLAVAFGATELLEEAQDKGPALSRLKSAIKDMQLLTEGILWLGRDPTQAKACDISSVSKQCIAAYQHLAKGRELSILLDDVPNSYMPVPEPVAHVMVGNILRNALAYTREGTVEIKTDPASLVILDTGAGYGQVAPDKEGFGIGLSLVERLCTHFDITLEVSARAGGGTKAFLSWSEPPSGI